METIPFYELLNTESSVWSLVDTDHFPTLYPPTSIISESILTPEMKDNINQYYYYREIAFSSPTRFLREFWRVCKERASIWKKAVDTETFLDLDDLKYNYNLYEESERDVVRNTSSENTNTPNLTTTTSPDLETVTENTNTLTSRMMDTPDGITTDIEDYLSSAQKDITGDSTTETQSGTNTIRQTGTNETVSEEEQTHSDEFNMHRYGNIGVQTSAKIVQESRDLYLKWDAFENFIFPELNHLFLSVVDVDTIDLW